ncbi:MAG: AAA family ATPase [Sedimentisphaerales bacterium]|nr:AAA family ATPase [Sedimentisphaerales bacterium]
MSDIQHLTEMIRAGTAAISIVTHEETYALECLCTAAFNNRKGVLIWSAGCGFRDGILDKSPVTDTDNAISALRYILLQNQKIVYVMLDLSAHIKDNVVMRLLRDTIQHCHSTGANLTMIDAEDRWPAVISSHVTSYDLSLPDEKELVEIVRNSLKSAHKARPIRIEISQQGMDAIIRNLRGLTRRQVKDLVLSTIGDNRVLNDDDVVNILAGKRKMLRVDGLLTYVEAPLTLDEIGGMENLKRWLNTRKGAFSKEARSFGLEAPKGVLMLGVQGAGKSLCAKAVATAWQQPLLRLDPGRLYNSYVGESERNLRLALRQVEMMSPAVLWVDEIEKAFASAASRSTDGGLSQRMFGTLLTWMQEHADPVFVVATANDIAALPPELLRKGRFDEIFFIGLPQHDARRQIFEIHLRRRNRNPEAFDLEKLIECSDGYSGAEIEQSIVSAMHEAFGNGDVTSDHIIYALQNSPPLSVTMKERIAELYRWAQGRCVSAD